MPDQPTWLERVPDILAYLASAEAPLFLDRPAVERLFGLRRRQSIQLMHRLAGYQVGKTFLVDRDALAGFLSQPPMRQAADHAIQRKRRVLEHLAAARQDWTARKIRIPPNLALQPPRLPEGVELRSGQLIIRFHKPLELLEKLFALSRVLAENYDSLMGPQQLSGGEEKAER